MYSEADSRTYQHTSSKKEISGVYVSLRMRGRLHSNTRICESVSTPLKGSV